MYRLIRSTLEGRGVEGPFVRVIRSSLVCRSWRLSFVRLSVRVARRSFVCLFVLLVVRVVRVVRSFVVCRRSSAHVLRGRRGGSL